MSLIVGGAVIIRDPEREDRGQIIDGEGSVSPIALMAMQAAVATRTPGLDASGPLISPVTPGKQFFPTDVSHRPPPLVSHVLINMRAFVGSICNSANEGVEVMFALYARHEHTFLTEFFLVKLNHNGVPAGPKPEDLVGRIQTLFTDLTSRDVAEEVYLVCRIFKTGEAKEVLRPGTANTSSTSSKERNSLLFDISRPGSPGGNRLQKTGSTIRPRGSRVSQIFTRTASPHESVQSVGNPGNVKTNGVHKGPVYRRPFGCAVLDLSQLLQEASSSSTSEGGTDHVMQMFVPVQEQDFHLLHERIIDSRTNKLCLSLKTGLTVVRNSRRQTVSMSILKSSMVTELMKSSNLTPPFSMPSPEPIA